MRQNARAGLETLTRDIEMAGYQTTSYGDPNKTGLAITLATEHEIEMDQQRVEHTSGSVDWANPVYEPKLVYYHLATDMRTGRQNLYRQIRTQPGLRSTDEIVAENISNFTLTYLDKNTSRGLPVPHSNHSRYTFGTPRPRDVTTADRLLHEPRPRQRPESRPVENIRAHGSTTVPAGATTSPPAPPRATQPSGRKRRVPTSGRRRFHHSGTNVIGRIASPAGKMRHFSQCRRPGLAKGRRAMMPIRRDQTVHAHGGATRRAGEPTTPDCIPPTAPTGLWSPTPVAPGNFTVSVNRR
jgi:hypothetical protein